MASSLAPVLQLYKQGPQKKEELTSALKDFAESKAEFQGDLCLAVAEILGTKSIPSPALIDFLNAVTTVDNAMESVVFSPNFKRVILSVQPATNTKVLGKLLEILRGLQSRNKTLHMAIDSDCYRALLLLLLDAIASPDLAVSEISALMTEVMLHSSVEDIPALIARCKQINDSTATLRYATVIARLLATDDEHFQICAQNDAARMIIELCRSTDILLQMVAIELLVEFASTASGVRYLFSEGALHWLLQLAYGADGVPADPLMASQALREISNIFQRASSKCLLDTSFWNEVSDKGVLTSFLRSSLCHIEGEGNSEDIRLAGLSALTEFCCSGAVALEMVLHDQELLSAWMTFLNAKVEMQAAFMHGIAKVIRAGVESPSLGMSTDMSVDSNTSSAPSDTVFNTITAAAVEQVNSANANKNSATSFDPRDLQYDDRKKELFHSLGISKRSSSMDVLMKYVRQPVPPTKHAALDVLQAVAMQPRGWGLQVCTCTEASIYSMYV